MALGDAFYNHIDHINQDLLGSLISQTRMNTLNDWDPPSSIKNDQRRNRVLYSTYCHQLSKVTEIHLNKSQPIWELPQTQAIAYQLSLMRCSKMNRYIHSFPSRCQLQHWESLLHSIFQHRDGTWRKGTGGKSFWKGRSRS